MGTNYYLTYPEKRCEHCGSTTSHEKSNDHIGKSSAGWHFAFNSTVRKTAEQWKKTIDDCITSGGWISDERDGEQWTAISPSEFWEMVRKKREAPNCATTMRGMFAQPNPSTCCDGVDFCPYEFS